ncbi:hypothetical protein [Paractinoplanes deccanensis]|uniref:hypothetical protein n=1 Tax=Paractinoplanes deccanensis TaxID=113561 RepID=UPI0019447D14|nr:hypothetical protein [Actinoplanes deccanensis]
MATSLDALMVTDAAWFEQRPDAQHRCRWITAAERMELPVAAGRSLSPKSVIHVTQIEPGVRRRQVLMPGDEFVPAGLVGLFGHRASFALAERDRGPIPVTRTGELAGGLEARFFRLPDGLEPDGFVEFDGIVVLRPGDALPVPFR